MSFCVDPHCSDGVVYELDISTGTCLRTLKGHNMIITAIYVSYNFKSQSGANAMVLVDFRSLIISL